MEGTAIPWLCKQLVLEPELTLQKTVVISSHIETAKTEAIDHVKAVHSLTGYSLNWHKCGRQSGGKWRTSDTSRNTMPSQHPLVLPSQALIVNLCISSSALKENHQPQAITVSNYVQDKSEREESQTCAYSCHTQRRVKTSDIQLLLK